MENFIASIMPTLEHLGMLGYWLVFIVAFSQGLVFIGSFVPGGALITLAGFFSAQGYLSLYYLIIFTSFGVMLGDGFSYWLGTKSKRLFKQGRFLLNDKNLERGKRFFNKHGGKSILMGRFISPLRSVVPFVAGAAKMDKWEFLFWNILSGIAWAVFHLLVGYFFSGTVDAIGAWSTRVGVFIVAIVAAIIILRLIVRYAHPFFILLKSILISIKGAIISNPDVQKLIHKYPKLFSFLGKRLNVHNFSGLLLTFLVIAFIYVLSIFAGTIESVLSNEIIVEADVRITNLLYAFRNLGLIKVFLWITSLANSVTIISFVTISSIILWLRNKKTYILPLLVTVTGATLFYTVTKAIIHRSRPELAYYLETGYSFPSGHATIAVAFYGFIAYIIFSRYRRLKVKVNIVFWALLTIFAIGLSRLYLCVHYMSDVWAGYLLGALWLIIGIILSEWLKKIEKEKKVKESKNAKMISIILVIWAVILYVGFAYQFSPDLNKKAVIQDVVIIDDVSDIFKAYDLTEYSETLYGNRMEPVSLIIVAKGDQHLIDSMKNSGWDLAELPNISTMIKSAKTAINNDSYPTAPMTPSFWNAEVHNFGFQKPTDKNSVRYRHHARFWKTNIQTQDGRSIYVGTISLDVGIKWYITHRIGPDIDTERELMLSDLKRADKVNDYYKIQLVEPHLGKNFVKDQFFTDGKSYIIYLK